MKHKHFFWGLLMALLTAFSAQGQIIKPVKWTAKTSVPEAQIGQTIELLFQATIQPGWYLYATDFDPELGPTVTTFTFTPNASYALVGKATSPGAKRKHDDIWDGEISYYKGQGTFVQKVKVLSADFSIKASVSAQACSDESGQCVPLDEDFNIKGLKVLPAKAAPAAPAAPAVAETAQQPAVTDSAVAVQVDSLAADVADAAADSAMAAANQAQLQQPTAAEEPVEDEGLWGIMISAFLFGLAAIFTPCVFPMIPLTVSFFTKNEGGRKMALFYGFSIIAIYTMVGAVLAPLSGDPSVANALSTHWLPNTLFFVIFIVFAISFFGAFEITMPAALVNKMDQRSDGGGLLAVFFMALTLVLVSFSCTGPIVGTILIESVGGQFLKPMAAMFAFALAFAMPFTVFALFPGLMKSMPKSGGWLNSVKVVLGFVELALAFKFLSNIDLVYHWGLLDKDVMLAIWIAIFSFLGLYLLGKLRLPHDSPMDSISVPRMLLALSVFSFVVYLIPGLFGAPIKLLSGILPPQSHHSFDLQAIIRQEVGQATLGAAPAAGNGEVIKHADRLKMPLGLRGYFDYKQALEASKREGKPVFIDFTGHGCANCRKMEDNVWVDPRVRKRLQEDYILVALYVDDPTELPESDWVTSAFDGKVKKTIGQVNFDLQLTKFNGNAQPYYTLVDDRGNLLLPPKAYDLNVDHFVEFLDRGVQAYQGRKQ